MADLTDRPLLDDSSPGPVACSKVMELARLLAEQPTGASHERRARRRYTLVIGIKVQPLDDQLRHIGPPSTAASYSLSTMGIGFVCVQPLAKGTFIMIDIVAGSKTIRLLAEVVRCRSVEEHYDVGAQLVRRLSSSD